jgi:hypothetical protein
MDRRNFIKKLIITPALAPLFLAANRTSPSGELFLITDEPARFLGRILSSLQNIHVFSGKDFTCASPHPQKKGLARFLGEIGWSLAENPDRADISISFRLLQHAVQPSFSLVKNDRIWDIRSQKLYSLWKHINSCGSPSRSLTVVTLTKNPRSRLLGESVVVFQSGKLIDSLPLTGSRDKNYKTLSGVIRVHTENESAWISNSPCRHRICLLSPPVSSAGERIICAPNHFMLKIQGPRGVDTVIG